MTRPRVTPADRAGGREQCRHIRHERFGSYNQATALFDFAISPGPLGSRGNGLGFALLNTGNQFGTQGGANLTGPEQEALFANSLGVGFVTSPIGVHHLGQRGWSSASIAFRRRSSTSRRRRSTWRVVSASMPKSMSTSRGRDGQHPTLTRPRGASLYTIVPTSRSRARSLPVAGQLRGRATGTAANPNDLPSTGLDNVNVRTPGVRTRARSLRFVELHGQRERRASPPSTSPGRSLPAAPAGTYTVVFVTVDGTAKNGLNYQSITTPVTFGEGEATKTGQHPDHRRWRLRRRQDGLALLEQSHAPGPAGFADPGDTDDRQHRCLHAPDRVAEGPGRLRPAHTQGPGVPADLQHADGRRLGREYPELHKSSRRAAASPEERTIAIAQAVLDYQQHIVWTSLPPGERTPGPPGAGTDVVEVPARLTAHRPDRYRRDLPRWRQRAGGD